MLYDDDRGVGEPLNETGVSGEGLVIRGKHLLILDTIDNSAYAQRMVAEELMMTPELAFTPTDGLQLGDYNLKVLNQSLCLLFYTLINSTVDYLLHYLIMFTC